MPSDTPQRPHRPQLLKADAPQPIRPSAPNAPTALQMPVAPSAPKAPVMPTAPSDNKGAFTNAVRTVANAMTGVALNRQIAQEQQQAVNQQARTDQAEIHQDQDDRQRAEQALTESLLEERKKGRLAFILGNGINRYNPNDLSWNELIKQIWIDCLEKDISIPSDGILLTELYDMATLNEISKISPEDTDLNRKIANISNDLKSNIRSRVKEMVCRKKDYHKWLQERLTEWNVPVLTTNYDTNIEQRMKQFVIPSSLYTKGYSDTYLFNVYYANEKIDNTAEENYFKHFAIWHINGRVNHLRSIRIGMSDYMNLLVATKDLLHKKAHLYYVGTEQPQWGMESNGEIDSAYTFTWLNIFYNCSICINGLALNQDESYLRWLLVSRKKYLERVGLRDVKGWYVCHPSDLTEGKRFFLEKTGIKVVELNDNLERYEKIFELK